MAGGKWTIAVEVDARGDLGPLKIWTRTAGNREISPSPTLGTVTCVGFELKKRDTENRLDLSFTSARRRDLGQEGQSTTGNYNPNSSEGMR